MKVSGTSGYERFIEGFIKSSQALDFHTVCKDFIEFLPTAPANVLDAGSGAGQNAASLAQKAYSVTAVEPMEEFLNAAKLKYQNLTIKWLQDSLPHLKTLNSADKLFDFILIDGVWHHLSEMERQQAIQRFAGLLTRGGVIAISLRNGPAGMGNCIYETSTDNTVATAKNFGFKCIFRIENQPSIFKHKKNVFWSRLVLKKVD